MKMTGIVGSICITGLVFAVPGSSAGEALPGAERHHWRQRHSQHSLATAPDVIASSAGFRYHFGSTKCVEGLGTCDLAY